MLIAQSQVLLPEPYTNGNTSSFLEPFSSVFQLNSISQKKASSHSLAITREYTQYRDRQRSSGETDVLDI